MLIHGLLLSRKMHTPLAAALAERGNRVICLDLLGHGESDKPARHVALLDAAVRRPDARAARSPRARRGGCRRHLARREHRRSRPASKQPERLRGMVIEMPVLDNALLGCAIAFAPLLVATDLRRAARPHAGRRRPPGAARHLLLRRPLARRVSQDPGPASAVLQGLFFGRVAPPRAERRLIETKALVIGHPRDPVHPFSDSDMLVRELPNCRLVEANSIARAAPHTRAADRRDRAFPRRVLAAEERIGAQEAQGLLS